MCAALNGVEIESTFLASSLPDLSDAHAVSMEDVYFPDDLAIHPRLRVRRRGYSFELTKKLPILDSDSSQHSEATIALTATEYEALTRGHSRRITKTRHHCALGGRAAELDVFGGTLTGLILIDFEFASRQEREIFVAPLECLVEVTNEAFLAGGMLSGRSYADIALDLARLGYAPLG